MQNITNLLSEYPRYDLIGAPTPIQELKSLNEHLGGIRVFIKRDDPYGCRARR